MVIFPTLIPRSFPKMNKWLEIAIYVGGGILVTYVTMSNSISQHSYRLDRIEHEFDQHISEHQKEFKEVRDLLTDIQIKIAKISGDK